MDLISINQTSNFAALWNLLSWGNFNLSFVISLKKWKQPNFLRSRKHRLSDPLSEIYFQLNFLISWSPTSIAYNALANGNFLCFCSIVRAPQKIISKLFQTYVTSCSFKRQWSFKFSFVNIKSLKHHFKSFRRRT